MRLTRNGILFIVFFLLISRCAFAGWLVRSGAQIRPADSCSSGLNTSPPVHWTSDFGRARFTWLAWVPDHPMDLRKLDCLRFRLTGPPIETSPGSPTGHRLFVRLLAPVGSETTSVEIVDGTTLTSKSVVSPVRVRYYDNHRQSVPLDFNGPREVVLDLSE
ncbi:MAG: hypothetical protein Q4C47_09315, partial [Planctomycetia bacterium]|nr:hypothetical protein [Planctomycetia bacterium]